MKMTQHWCMIREIAVDSRCRSYNLVGLACDDWGGRGWGKDSFWGDHIIIGRSSSRLPSKTEFGKGSSIQLFLAEA